MIDLRSDTVTQPTEAMRAAMAKAEVGDDVYGDDPTVNRLQQLAAEVTGKEEALFVPSGTMGNQLAVFAHTRRGDSAVCLRKSHINEHECGAAAMISGVTLDVVDSPDGVLRGRDIQKTVRPDDIHCPPTALICTENALATGSAVSLAEAAELYKTAKDLGLAVHMDGARLFNAAAALSVSAAEITRYTDSVMFCVSKGLSAPVGSLLCGDRAFIGRAKRGRKLLGGGMRQAGILAAAGIIAIEEMAARLREDHRNAAALASRLTDIPGVEVMPLSIPINMVFARFIFGAEFSEKLPAEMLKRSVKINPLSDGWFRFVTHRGVSESDVELAAAALAEIAAG